MTVPPKKPAGLASAAAKPPPPPEAPAGEQLQASDLDDLTHAEFRLLYEEAARNVLFAKGQQWRVLEYFTLLAVALVAIGIAMPYARDVARFVAGFLILVAGASIGVLLMLQVWQHREHAKMGYLIGDLSNFARTALRLKPSGSGDIHRYLMLGGMMLYIIVLILVVVRLLGDLGA